MSLLGPRVQDPLTFPLKRVYTDNEGWPTNGIVRNRRTFTDIGGGGAVNGTRQPIPDFCQGGPFAWPIHKDAYPTPAHLGWQQSGTGAYNLMTVALGYPERFGGVRQLFSWYSNNSTTAASTKLCPLRYPPIGTLLVFGNSISTSPNTIVDVECPGYEFQQLCDSSRSNADVVVWVGRRVINYLPYTIAGAADTVSGSFDGATQLMPVVSVRCAQGWRSIQVIEVPRLVGELVQITKANGTTDLTPAPVSATPGRSDEFYIGGAGMEAGGAGWAAFADPRIGYMISGLGELRWGDPWDFGGTIGGTYDQPGGREAAAFHAIVR